MTTVLITGNTYPVKDQLRDLGGKWDATNKVWRVPPDKAVAAQALVASAPAATKRSSSGFRRNDGFAGKRTSCRCGSIEGRPRNSDCRQCQYDNE